MSIVLFRTKRKSLWSVMFRKLRRLRAPVCFYTCCSLFAILLFVSFNEDVKNLIQQSTHNRPGGPSGSSQNFPTSFSSFSSGGSGGTNKRPLVSFNPSGIDPGVALVKSRQWNVRQQRSQDAEYKSHKQPLEPSGSEKRKESETENDDDEVIKQYINDNFVGHPPPEFQTDPERLHPTPHPQEQKLQTTNVISNLVKLAQQASNDPNKFSNINTLTGETTGGGQNGDSELSQMFLQAHQSSTADTDLIYPGGDANNPMKRRDRQWFMTGGDFFPTPPGGLASIFYPSAKWLASKPSTLDYAHLWYDNTVGSDRVIEQLMFAIDDPINYANFTWGLEGSTATTANPSDAVLTNNNDLEQQNNAVDTPNGLVMTAHQHVRIPNVENSELMISPNQLLVPASVSGQHSGDSNILRDPRLGKVKTILLYYGLGMSWGSHISAGRQVFLKQNCPVNACRLTGNRAQLSKADVVVFKDVFMHPKIRRPKNQLWVMYMLECPLNTQNFQEKNAFNLTATYRHDSDIVTPYEKWVYFDDSVRSLPQAINYAEGKTKKVAWFVSNCVAKNNRLEFARELAKHIEVDIYGACGTHTCSRANAKQCFEMLSTNYKFYLAFENSNCRDYISEKFFVNGLGNNVLPIVMGAHPDDYKRVAPDRSYIHVDDFSSPKELAQYLHELDANDDLYNEYFKWKGTGEFINTHFFCRLCAMAHYASRNPRKPSHYEDFNRWWRGPHVCTRSSWRSTPDIFAQENYDAFISNNR